MVPVHAIYVLYLILAHTPVVPLPNFAPNFVPRFKKLSSAIFSMARVRREQPDGKVGAVMIDGFAPDLDEFANLPWQKIRVRTRMRFHWWLDRVRAGVKRAQRDYKETTYLTAYRNAVRLAMDGLCECRPPELRPKGKRPLTPCVYIGYATGDAYVSIENPERRTPKSARDEMLPVLQREFRHDEEEGREHYLQHVVLYPTLPEFTCERAEECCAAQLERLHFREKPENEYLDYGAFSEAWSAILDERLFRERLSDYEDSVVLYQTARYL